MIEPSFLSPMADPSCSGYVPVPFARFMNLAFPERMAFADADLMQELSAHDLAPLQAGFCDWVDVTTGVQICVGWAWYLRFGDACEKLAPGGFSNNVMFVDAAGRPLGPRVTERMLGEWLATRAWQSTLQASMGAGYGHFADHLH